MGANEDIRTQGLEFAARLERIAAGIRVGDLGVMEFARHRYLQRLGAADQIGLALGEKCAILIGSVGGQRERPRSLGTRTSRRRHQAMAVPYNRPPVDDDDPDGLAAVSGVFVVSAGKTRRAGRSVLGVADKVPRHSRVLDDEPRRGDWVATRRLTRFD